MQVFSKAFLFYLLLGFSVVAHSFVPVVQPQQVTTASKWSAAANQHQRNNKKQKQPLVVTIARVRGGQSDYNSRSHLSAAATPFSLATVLPTILSLVTTNLKAGPLGVLSLASVAATVCVPITQIKSTYGISIGYGSSVALMGLALRLTLTPAVGSIGDWLTQATIFYGVRLAGYLWLRDRTSWKKTVVSERAESPRLKRIPFAASLAVFYACMTTPVLYALRHCSNSAFSMAEIAADWPTMVAWTGVVTAWLGAVLEAAADNQKYVLKQQTRDDPPDLFQGPTSGVYRLTRHPNYTGEILFWFGIWLAGVPFFGSSLVAWLCSSLGLLGIVSIMRTATKRLEERQAEKYGGQEEYEDWKKSVTGPLFPFLAAI